MREKLNLKISQFVDGELAAEDAVKLLESMQEDPELDRTFRRYEAVSQVLKSDAFLVADTGFVERVSAQLKNEPTVLSPSKQLLRYNTRNMKVISALAASFAIITVIIAGALQFREKQGATGVELAQSRSNEQVYVDSSHAQDDDKLFNDYLEAHGATLYSGDHASSPAYGTSQTYGRVVNYGRK